MACASCRLLRHATTAPCAPPAADQPRPARWPPPPPLCAAPAGGGAPGPAWRRPARHAGRPGRVKARRARCNASAGGRGRQARRGCSTFLAQCAAPHAAHLPCPPPTSSTAPRSSLSWVTRAGRTAWSTRRVGAAPGGTFRGGPAFANRLDGRMRMAAGDVGTFTPDNPHVAGVCPLPPLLLPPPRLWRPQPAAPRLPGGVAARRRTRRAAVPGAAGVHTRLWRGRGWSARRLPPCCPAVMLPCCHNALLNRASAWSLVSRQAATPLTSWACLAAQHILGAPPRRLQGAQRCTGGCEQLFGAGRRCYPCHANELRNMRHHTRVSYALDMGNAM